MAIIERVLEGLGGLFGGKKAKLTKQEEPKFQDEGFEEGFETVTLNEVKNATNEINIIVAEEKFASSPAGHLKSAKESIIAAGKSFFKAAYSAIKFAVHSVSAVANLVLLSLKNVDGSSDKEESTKTYTKEAKESVKAASGDLFEAASETFKAATNTLDAFTETFMAAGKFVLPKVKSASAYTAQTLSDSFDFTGTGDEVEFAHGDILGSSDDGYDSN